MDLENLKDAALFQEHFVTPLINAVRVEVRPMVLGHKALEDRVGKLETNQRKALWGLSAMAGLLSVAFGIVIDWIKKKLGIH